MKAAFLSPTIMIPLVSPCFSKAYQSRVNKPLTVLDDRLKDWARVHERLKLEKDVSKTLFVDSDWVRAGPERIQWSLKDTQKFFDNQKAKGLRNGSFFVDLSPKESPHSYGLYSRPFMLERLNSDSYHLLEVLLSDKPTEQDLLELSMQFYVLKAAGVDVKQASYVVQSAELYAGEKREAKYQIQDYTQEVLALQEKVKESLDEIKRQVKELPPPVIGQSRLESLEYPVSALLHSRYKYWMIDRLVALGIVDMRNIPADFRGLEDYHKDQIKAHRKGEAFFNLEGLKQVFARRKYPVHYLDFETRVYDKDKPTERQIPHQFSNHIISKSGEVMAHDTFLPQASGDPRLDFARSLVASVQKFGGEGTVVVYYKKFENSRIIEVAEYVKELGHDELAESLLNILDRIEDQLVYLKENVSHPGFMGSYSLKSTHPALVKEPKYSYKDMEVQDGMQAAHAIAEMMDLMEFVEKQGVDLKEHDKDSINALKRLKDLRLYLKTYCGADTWNNVEIDKVLMGQLKQAGMSW